MGLSHDIISEFVKITNDNKEKPKEGIVYATIVQASNGKYVKIDGSDLLTPTDTTTDIEDGERVTVMIKDHKATVTGNVTAPSASGNRVDKVVETVTEQIGVFETVVADKVSTNELEAYKITVDTLIAGKAEIEDLEATNAVIENLKVKDAEIENLVADKATIEDLEAVNATIENLKVKDAEIENAVIGNLEATKAEIGILEADFAQIKTLVSGNLTSDNILSFNITADKVTMEDAFIKDAMIDTVNASKINAGKINTNSVSIGSEDGGMLITGATQQFTDKNGNVRIQIGRDTSGDFTFALYGEDGQGQLINQNGITASAIADGLIVNDMVSNDAAISGDKLDISSVVTEINNDNTTTIKSNKIYLDEQNQSLEVAFNKLKTQVDTIKDVDVDGELTTITEKVQSNTAKIEANTSSIGTLITENTTIKKQVTDLEGNVVETTNALESKYTTLNQSLDGFKTSVANTYATKSSVNDVKNNLSTNYSTTSAMNSAINQKVDEINLGVSNTYETKTNVETKINNIQVGGRNLAQQSHRFNKGGGATGITSISNSDGSISVTASSGNGNWFTSFIVTSTGIEKSFNEGDTFTISFIASSENTTKIPTIYIKAGMGYYPMKGTLGSKDSVIYYTGVWKKANDISIHLGFSGIVGTINFKKWKLEKGNKATDWSPAPEDVTADISTAKTEAINTAASDATNKANNAKNEAINSANSTLTTTIANYYTKAQTDSQINVAKNAITSSVSSTYETKAEVTNKINGIKIGGRNLIKKKSEFMYGYIGQSNGSLNNTGSSLNSNQDFYTNEYFPLKTGESVCFTSYPKQTVNSSIKSAAFIHVYNSSKVWQKAIYHDTNTANATANKIYTATEDCYVRFCSRGFNDYNHMAEYATKPSQWSPAPEDVETTVSTIEQRVSAAESKITDSSITNVVKQNFYTKTETDGKVTTVQNNMQSSITQLSNQIATKVDVNGVLSTIQQNPNSIQIGFNKISNALTIDSTGMIAKAQNGNKYYQLGYNGITMYNPANGTYEWGRVSAIDSKFTVASNGNSSGLSLGHFVNGSYVEDILCSSAGVVHIQRQMNHNGILYNNYGQIIVRQSGQGGWEITGRSDSQTIKPGGANQGAIGSSTQYINQSWIANRYNPSSLKLKHLSHYIDDLECLKLVNDIKPARYFYKEYDENGDDVTTFTSRTSQLGLIYEDVRACSGRDLITNEEDAAINLYGMVSVLWGAVRNLNGRLNDVEYENVTLKNELEEVKNMLNKS